MKSKTLQSKPLDSTTPEDFSSAITRTAVAQICQTAGFRAAQRSALETLTDVAARYLRALGSSAASSAACAGRTESNLFDIIQALKDLNSVQGFIGASDVSRSLFPSSILKGIMRFVYYRDEIPFAKPIPRPNFSPKQSIFRRNLGPVKVHIPKWLPKVPEMGNVEGSKEESLGFGEVSDGCLGSEKIWVESEKEMERERKLELPLKRGEVRFRIGGREERFGVDLRNGVCRGGKRVSCQIWGVNQEVKNFRSKR